MASVFGAAAEVLGGRPPDAVLALLLGLDGPSYLGFRAAARRTAGEAAPTMNSALECFSFALDARRALERVMRPSRDAAREPAR